MSCSSQTGIMAESELLIWKRIRLPQFVLDFVTNRGTQDMNTWIQQQLSMTHCILEHTRLFLLWKVSVQYEYYKSCLYGHFKVFSRKILSSALWPTIWYHLNNNSYINQIYVISICRCTFGSSSLRIDNPGFICILIIQNYSARSYYIICLAQLRWQSHTYYSFFVMGL